MYKDIQAVAFDIDGTLYPSWKLFIRMPIYILKNFRVYLNFNKARDKMHRTAPLADFYEYQKGYRKILHYIPLLFYSIFPIKAIPLHPEKNK